MRVGLHDEISALIRRDMRALTLFLYFFLFICMCYKQRRDHVRTQRWGHLKTKKGVLTRICPC